MEKDKIIVEMTPFLFEDGKTYYWFGLGPTETKVTTEYKCLNHDNGSLVNINLKADEIKREIKNVILANQAVVRIKDWDGFVGDIPTDAKKALAREAKLNDLGI